MGKNLQFPIKIQHACFHSNMTTKNTQNVQILDAPNVFGVARNTALVIQKDGESVMTHAHDKNMVSIISSLFQILGLYKINDFNIFNLCFIYNYIVLNVEIN